MSHKKYQTKQKISHVLLVDRGRGGVRDRRVNTISFKQRHINTILLWL